jgi:hypothetical protein
LLSPTIILFEMPPKAKKGIKEPDVVVPAGDPKIGKGIFEELCATCHGLDVRLNLFRVTVRVLQLLPSEALLAAKPEILFSPIVKP